MEKKKLMLKRFVLFRIFLFVLVFFMVFSWGKEGKFRAGREEANGKRVGVIYYSDMLVMRLFSTGEYLTTLARAQVVAYRLNSQITRLDDIKRIRFSYPNDRYTASIDGKKLFSIFEQEIQINNATPEGLMSSWVNNLKRAFVNEKEKIPVSKVTTVDTVAKQEKKAEQVSPTANKFVNSSTLKEQTSEYLAVEELKEKILKIEEKIRTQTRTVNPIISTSINVGMFLLNTIFIIYLIFSVFKLKRQLKDSSSIGKIGNMEELENAISVYLKELADKSDQISQKTKDAINALDQKVQEAKTTNVNSDAINEPEVPAVEPEVPAVNPAEQLAQEIEKSVPSETSQLEEPTLEVNIENHDGLSSEKKAMIAALEDNDLKEEVSMILENDMLDKNQKVVELTALNLEAEFVAKMLDIGMGEVELILQLNN